MKERKKQENYRVIYTKPGEIHPNNYTGELIDRKSLFIANIRKVEKEEDVFELIEQMRKKYTEACSHAYAYVMGKHGEYFRCNDNGEPGGTAGRPMMEVLQNSGIYGIAVVVSRYYGGIKLGTGGLIRAYTNVVKAALQKCPIAMMTYCERICVEMDYSNVGKVLYYMEQNNIRQEASEYTDKVRITVLLAEEKVEKFCKEVMNLTAGRSLFSILEEGFYQIPEKLQLFGASCIIQI